MHFCFIDMDLSKTKLNSLLCCILLLSSGCASSGSIIRTIARDAKVQDFPSWSPDLQEKEPYPAPYISTFHKAEKTLHFVALEHEQGIDSAGFRTIKWAFENNSIDAVAVEERSEAQPTDADLHACEKDQFVHCGESSYAHVLAKANGISVIPVDPNDKETLDSLKLLGYSESDLAFFFLVRIIPQWKRMGTLDKEHFDNQCESFLAKRFQNLGITWIGSCGEFKAWFEHKKPKGLTLFDVENEQLSPTDGITTNYFQEMNLHVLNARETHITNKILRALDGKSKILLEMGGNHLTRQRAFWEKKFGPSKNRRPIDDTH